MCLTPSKLTMEATLTTLGLTTAEAMEQLKVWGKNEIPEEKEPLWRLFAMQFVGTMPAMVRALSR